MENHFVKIEGQPIHFKTAGSGPPIVLLHPSPSSSQMFVPMMEKLADHFLLIAPDTPGYGQSQPLKYSFNNLTDYTYICKKLFEKIGLDRFAIYGSATGAQIGIRYALEYPNQVSHLYLDNAAHFSEEERRDVFQHYFPDLTPKMDGSHLTKTWEIVDRLFKYFPWYKTRRPLQLILRQCQRWFCILLRRII